MPLAQALDETLYNKLKAWDELGPSGVLDASNSNVELQSIFGIDMQQSVSRVWFLAANTFQN